MDGGRHGGRHAWKKRAFGELATGSAGFDQPPMSLCPASRDRCMDYEAANAGISPVKTRYYCRERYILVTNAVTGFPSGMGESARQGRPPVPEGWLEDEVCTDLEIFEGATIRVGWPPSGESPVQPNGQRKASMNKIKQTVKTIGGFLKSLGNGLKRGALAVAVAGTVAFGALSAHAQGGTTPDPTTIYSSAQSDFNAAVGIAIGAIGIGAAVFFIRKGLKARM